MLGALVWHGAPLLLAWWLASRRSVGGGWAGVAVLAQLLTWVALLPWQLGDPWTPLLAVALVVPLLFACWGLAERDLVAGIWAVVLAVVAVQIHVGYVVLAGGPLLAAMAMGRVWRFDRRTLARPVVRRGALAIGVLVLPWVLDLLLAAASDRRSNVVALVRFFTSSADGDRRVGLARAARTIAHDVSWDATWLGGDALDGFFGASSSSAWWLLVPVGLLAGGAVAAWRRGDRSAVRLVGLAASVFVTGIVATAQVRGFLFDYLVVWRAPIAIFVAAAGGAALAPAFGDRVCSARSTVAWFVTCAALACSAEVLVADHATRKAWHWNELAADAVVAADAVPADAVPADAATDPGVGGPTSGAGGPTSGEAGTILLRQADAGWNAVFPVVLWSLDHAGVDVRVDPTLGYLAGSSRVLEDPGAAAEIWYVTDSSWAYSVLRGEDGARVVASVSPFSTEDEAEYDRLARAISGQLLAAGRPDLLLGMDDPLIVFSASEVPGIDHDALQRLSTLDAELVRRPRAAVIAFAPDEAPDFFVPFPDGF
ncbi:MAG: hypothetical protein R2715_20270 [Ilumatobacteraceae bacterium]